MKLCMNSHGHMTKMATMAINNKNLLKKIFFFRTRRPMILKLGMNHQEMEVYKIHINHDPGLTLTNFTAGSPMHLNGEIVKMSFEGQNLQ